MSPVTGVSIRTRNVSFQDRLIIREIIPTVLMNVLSSTLTLRHTVLAMRVVSLDNLDVTSPTHTMNENMFFCPDPVSSVLSTVILLLRCEFLSKH